MLNQRLSLLSPVMIESQPGLLLQFLLANLLETFEALLQETALEKLLSPHPRFFPYDWARPHGHLNKAQEHVLLLSSLFPDHAKSVQKCEKCFFKLTAAWQKEPNLIDIREVYLSLEPLIATCKDDENLLFFLLKNKNRINGLMHSDYLRQFLLQLHPEGLLDLGEKLCDNYHRRGFFSVIADLKLLIAQL